MTHDPHSVTVKLIGYEYRFACPPAEQAELRDAARLLNERMTEIRGRGKHLSIEAIAVMAALNLSHDVQRQQRQVEELDAMVSRQARDLLQKIDAVL